jgi:hypothetical protein
LGSTGDDSGHDAVEQSPPVCRRRLLRDLPYIAESSASGELRFRTFLRLLTPPKSVCFILESKSDSRMKQTEPYKILEIEIICKISKK